MPHSFRIKLSSASGEEYEMSGEILDNDWAILLEYKREVERLVEALKECDHFNVNLTINFDRSGEISSTSRIPSNRDLSLVLHRIRPFVLQNEPVNFNRSVNIVKQAVPHLLMERAIRALQDLYSGRDFQSQSMISSGDIVVNSEKTLQDWLNSSEYHRDPERKVAIDELDSQLPPDVSRALFIAMIVDKVKAIIAFGRVVAAFERGMGTCLNLRLSAPRGGQSPNNSTA